MARPSRPARAPRLAPGPLPAPLRSRLHDGEPWERVREDWALWLLGPGRPAGWAAEEVGRWWGEAQGRGPEEGEEDGQQRRRGVFYTPDFLVEALLDEVGLDEAGPGERGPGEGGADRSGSALRRERSVLDPACGAGAFLVGAARRMLRGERDRLGALRAWAPALRGWDLDPVAVAITRQRLAELVPGGDPTWFTGVRVGDGLLGGGHAGGLLAATAEPADVVLGNPPFLSQLSRHTATDRARAAALKARFGGRVGAYTDPAGLFLLAGLDALRPGGRLGFVLPVAWLGTRDAAPVREAVEAAGALRWLWWSEGPVFEGAEVYTVAVVLEKGGAPGPVRRARGPARVEVPAVEVEADTFRPTWGPLVGDLLGAPRVRLQVAGVLGELAETEADFRDEFYGLQPAVVEAEGGALPRLVTVGAIGLGRHTWGERPITFGKRRWAHPRVDPARLDGPMRAWLRRRLVPKLLLATQTKVLEACADPEGALVPTTPVVSVSPRDPAELWRVMAVLLAPAVSAWALARWGVTALSPGTLKLSAAQVRELPLPAGREAWAEAAEKVRAAHEGVGAGGAAALMEAAVWMDRAYGVEPGLVGWWGGRGGVATGVGGRPDQSRISRV